MFELSHGCLETMHLLPSFLLHDGYSFIEDIDFIIELSLLGDELIFLEGSTDQLLLHLGFFLLNFRLFIDRCEKLTPIIFIRPLNQIGFTRTERMESFQFYPREGCNALLKSENFDLFTNLSLLISYYTRFTEL